MFLSFSASEPSVTYPGIEAGRGAGNSNSEHSVPHLGWKCVGGRGEKVRIPAPSTLFLTLGLKGEGGRSGNSDSKRSYSLTLGLKGVRGRSGNSNSEHSIPHPGVEGVRGEEWEFRLQAFLFLTLGLKGVG